MSLHGRREGLPVRTVLIPVEHGRRRGGGLRRWLLVALGAAALLAGGAALFDIVHRPAGNGTGASKPPPRKSQAPQAAAAVSLAQAQERTVSRLAGLGVPVFCGASRGNDVALTFDDGPGPYTARVLAVLRRYHAAATFFLVGNRIRYWPRLPAAEATIGAVGDHTWSHADLRRLLRVAAKREIDRTRTALAAAANTTVGLFRIPYGREPAWLGRSLAARAMLEIRWSVDSSDYLPGTTVAKLLRREAPGLKPGAIVLLHDLKPVTLHALPQLLALIRARHLRPVTVPELLRTDAPDYSQLMTDNRGRGCVDLATARRE